MGWGRDKQFQIWLSLCSGPDKPMQQLHLFWAWGLSSVGNRCGGDLKTKGAYYPGIRASFQGQKPAFQVMVQLETKNFLLLCFHCGPPACGSLSLSHLHPTGLLRNLQVSGRGCVWDASPSLGYTCSTHNSRSAL